ncbi:MAG: hypothetical protein HYZ57_20560 [Acidobacteria bacterium]|nr:hypothetical protein [Acidobacteriota bacterium]MBI3282219.1 hypothetical protein [Acidobacteriota bacterium]
MKTLMSLMLGLSLVFGTAAFAAEKKGADAKPAAEGKKKKKSKKKKGTTAEGETPAAPAKK